jgi:hypothetical protein
MFMNMDELMGKEFEAGLDNLSRIAEAEAKKAAPSSP